MNELIPLCPQTINGVAVETVSARELHAFLESKQDFSTWIKNRIEKYEFVENQDFVVFHKKMENPNGGRPSHEYYVSVGMAKELAMVENNEKGKQARKYFIECEKQLLSQRSLPRTYAEALRAYADEVEARELAEQQLAIAQPKVQYFDGLVERNVDGFDGYVSWLPKLAFEEQYKDDNLTFGQAVEFVKQGKKVARKGWNGKGMYLLLVVGECVTEQINDCYGDPERYEVGADGYEKGQSIPVLNAIYMKTADNKLVPWLASQTDMLSEDWQIV